MDELQIRKIAEEVMRRIEQQESPAGDDTETLVIIASQTVRDETAMAALRERFSGKLLFATMGREFEAADENTVIAEDDGIKNLLTMAAGSDDMVLLAPGIGQIENIAYGREGGACEEVLLRSILWGKKVHVLLDYTPPRFKRGTFYEKIGDAIDALTDMGVSVFTYSCLPQRPDVWTLVTENDVVSAYANGKTKITCAKGAIVTPSARDKAKELNMKIDWQG